MQYLDFRSENDIQVICSPACPETEIPVKASECVYCRKCKKCIMTNAGCSYISSQHICKLP